MEKQAQTFTYYILFLIYISVSSVSLLRYLLIANFSPPKGEAITFRATTAGVLTTLQHCVDVINQRDESWRRKLDRESEKRKKVEDVYR